jgi:transcriptional regulator with GAF, ATPase, and Fis domain
MPENVNCPELEAALYMLARPGIEVGQGQVYLFDGERELAGNIRILKKRIIFFPSAEVSLPETLTKQISAYTSELLDEGGRWRDRFPVKLLANASGMFSGGSLHLALGLQNQHSCLVLLHPENGRPEAMEEHGFQLFMLLLKSGLDRHVQNMRIRSLEDEMTNLRTEITLRDALQIRNDDLIEKQSTELDKYKRYVEAENSYLTEELKSEPWLEELAIYGNAMQQVSQLIRQVAPSDSTVLILGETGTGKELVARAVHAGSGRRDKIMVKINCAALPAGLVESELFGHERGSFTGATSRHIGKFELADNGTLFLDEIGEMPPEVQVKVLRVLQEREIERIGGGGVIKVNVRIIAATNRDLHREVLEGRFRSDLFYRLNVFPIAVPRLQERKEDIEKLVHQFIRKFSKAKGRRIRSISKKSLDELLKYDWPGNVRELEHLIERSILMTKGSVIRQLELDLAGKNFKKPTGEDTFKTSAENEREHILRALKKTKGKIYGKGGAAELLDINFNTLNSRMRKLDIQKMVFVSQPGSA